LLVVGLLLAASNHATVALAASDVAVGHATDGSVVVVGSGFRPESELIVGLGETYFPAYVDSAGAFEVNTGLLGFTGDLGVHHSARSMAILPLANAAPHPLAVLFAHGLLDGLTVFAIGGVLALGWALVRNLAPRRYPRP
jgi:hypothetical protein